jgi:hypothetical protein
MVRGSDLHPRPIQQVEVNSRDALAIGDAVRDLLEG